MRMLTRGFIWRLRLGKGGRARLLCGRCCPSRPAIAHVAEPHEAEQYHRPGRGFRDRHDESQFSELVGLAGVLNLLANPIEGLQALTAS
jgi:hypothetical protein